MAFYLILIRGMSTFTDLAGYKYQQQVLNISSSRMQVFEGITTFFWSVKFLFVFLFDRVLRRVRKTKYILVAVALGRTLSLVSIYYFQPTLYVYMAILLFETFCSVIENILGYHVLYISSQADSDTKKGDYLAYLPVFTSIGGVIGTYIGGYSSIKFGTSRSYLFSSILPFSTAVFALFTRERPTTLVEKNTFWSDLASMKEIWNNNTMTLLLSLTFLINVQPNFGSYSDYYLQHRHHSTDADLTHIRTIRSIFCILGSLLCAVVYKHISIKALYISVKSVILVSHAMFLLVSNGTALHYGLSTKLSVIIYYSVMYFLSEGGYLPLFMAWCTMIPKGFENSYMAIFTGLGSLGTNISNYLGAGLILMLDLEANNYARFDYIIYIRLVCLFGLILFVVLIPLPQGPKEEDEAPVEAFAYPMAEPEKIEKKKPPGNLKLNLNAID